MVEPFTGLIAGYLAGKSLDTAIRKLLHDRAHTAAEILEDQLRKGQSLARDIPESEVATIIFRYMRAAEEGAARLNLRLLASVAARLDPKEGFYGNEFLRWSNILADLSPEEIFILGTMHRNAADQNYSFERTGHFWMKCSEELERKHGWSYSEVETLTAPLLRTGLITMLSGLWVWATPIIRVRIF